MKILSYCMLQLVTICSTREGSGAAVTDPPSGSVIADFEGTENVTTLICNITNPATNVQEITIWSIGNFRGVAEVRTLLLNTAPDLFEFGGDPIPATPSFNFNNRLTILQLSSELDKAIVYCGIGGAAQQANFILKIYRPPILLDNFFVSVLEGSHNFPIDITQNPTAFPTETVSFSWTRNGQPLTTDPAQTYSSLTFSSVDRSDSGNYSVFATNVVEGREVGNDTGSFYLNVIYGPSFRVQGPTQRYTLFNSTLSLLCGTGLDSNPQATIIWTAPDGTTITGNARYNVENGPDIVRLNFTSALMSDIGIWRCDVTVESEMYVLSGGRLILLDPAIIGTISVNIQVIVITTPGPPSNPTIKDVGATWVHICWTAPLVADSPISRYEIIARIVNSPIGVVIVSTVSSVTFFNVTGLLPATTYTLTVVAISEGGDVMARSPESESIQAMTEVTVPEVVCSDPVSADGIIMVQWSYVHTGGLNLTSISAVYSFVDGTSTVTESVTIASLDTTSVEERGLVAGFVYMLNITAENSNGSSTVSCRPTPHIIGVPRDPQFGDVMSGPSMGEVTLQIKTVASGVNDPVQGFRFIITPVLDGDVLEVIPFDFPNYQSGELESITVRGLEPGRSYTFSATAMNTFGTSDATNSPPVRVATDSPSSESRNIGPLIGGVIGGVFVIIVLIFLSIIIVLVLHFFRKGVSHKTDSEVVYEEPDLKQYRPKKDHNIELEECPAYGERKTDQSVQLKECPAYGIL